MKYTGNKILLILILIFSFSINLSAQTKKEKKKLIKDRNNNFYSGSITQPDFNETIHFQYVGGLIVVSVKINGKLYDFIFDTGALTLVTEELAKELQLEKKGSTKMHDGTDTSRTSDIYSIKEMQIGNIVFNNTGCMVYNLDDISKMLCIKIDGIIGVNLMHECFWKIKFNDTTINLSGKLPAIPSTALALDFVENFGRSPFMQMQYEDSMLYIEFDSGSNGPLDINEDSSAINRKHKTNLFVAGYGITTQTFFQKLTAKKYMGIADSLKIGGVMFRNKIVCLSRERNMSLMGTSFMKNYESILDFENHKIYLNPLADTLDTKYSRSFGLNFLADSGKLKVVFLWEGSRAVAEGLKIGDEITSVNDVNTSHITNEQFCELKNEFNGKETLKLTIKDITYNEKTHLLNKYDLIKQH